MKGLQLPLGVQLSDHASFDNFHAGPNREAVAAVVAMLDFDAPQMLLLFGAPGSGKTHLLQSLLPRAAAAGACAYVPLRQLGVEALEGLHEVDLVCLDDADAALVDRPGALTLLRFLDQLRAHDGRAVLSTAAAPERLAVGLPDLRTRLAAAAVYGLKPLDDAQRAELLRIRAAARGLALADDAARLLLNRLPRDTGSLLDAVEALDRASLSAQRRLTAPFVQQWLRESGKTEA